MAQDATDSERRIAGPGDAPGLEPFNALLLRMLALPPKPHSEMKLGKPRGRKPREADSRKANDDRPSS
jgi:hypothetical protein